jgi:NADPH:quinone reductase
MKAIQVASYGGREGLALNEVAVPAPGEGQALVRLDLAGVNFIDVYMREGHYRHSPVYGTPLPFTIGMEGAGIVEQAGRGVTGVTRGDRVAYCLSRGAYAEYAAVPAWRLVKVPDDIALDVATVLMLQGCTAHYLSHSLFALREGHVCLVHAGAGGVGQLLIQLAKLRGAQVITTVGSQDKAALVRQAGADHVVLYRERDFREAVMEITRGRGVDVAYDAVGKATIEGSIRSVRRRGTVCNYGGASGLVESVSPLMLADAGSVFFTRPHLAHYTADTEEIAGRARDLFALVREGKLKVRVDRALPLAQAAEAHAVIEARGTTGKLLLRTSAG